MSTTSTRALFSTTNTITLDEPDSTRSRNLVLWLNPRKKKVTWKEGTVDNEFMGKKSSKKCCIFHKQKSLDEDASDEDEDDHHHHLHEHDDYSSKDAHGTSSFN